MTAPLVDAHCHLDFEAFDADRRAVLDRAAAAGVRGLIVPGFSPAQTGRGIGALAPHRDGAVRLATAVGVHPMAVPELDDATLGHALDELEASAANAGAVAIGECGLDGLVARRPGGDEARQVRAFVAQLDVAERLGLPVVLHVYRAHERALGILEARAPLPAGGMVHSYSGSAELVPRWLALGMDLSFAGGVTRPGARRPRAAAAAVPLDRLLVETDGPDQLPHGAPPPRNEPANLPRIVAAVADAKGVPRDVIAAASTTNALRRFFGGDDR